MDKKEYIPLTPKQEKEKKEIEGKMDALLAKKKLINQGITITIGDALFAFDGGLTELAEFIEKTPMGRLKPLESSDYYSLYGLEGLDGRYDERFYYLDREVSSVLEICDINLKPVAVYDAQDGAQLESLRKEYKKFALQPVESAKQDS